MWTLQLRGKINLKETYKSYFVFKKSYLNCGKCYEEVQDVTGACYVRTHSSVVGWEGFVSEVI